MAVADAPKDITYEWIDGGGTKWTVDLDTMIRCTQSVLRDTSAQSRAGKTRKK